MTKEAVVAKASAIRHAIAACASELTYAEAACAQADGIVTALEGAGHLPQDFAQWWARRNGDKALLLKQLDLQSLEFATAEKKPGSAPIRRRFLLAQGGEGLLEGEELLQVGVLHGRSLPGRSGRAQAAVGATEALHPAMALPPVP